MPQATLSYTATPQASSLTTAPAAAANPAHQSEFPDAPLAYRKHILANGLTLLVHEDRKAPLVSVQVWYHVGSKDEVPGKTGFAHLFEHLMFNGSEHHDDEFFRPLESAGASDINGTTNVDRTNFYETVPTGALDLALWLESDRMGNLLPAVTQAKLDEQRGVVKNEKRQREAAPYAKVDELIVQNSYPAGHPYSWTTIGSMEDLDRASLDDVRAWFKKYYGPNNATLIIAGDIDFATAVAKAEQYFGAIAAAPGVARRAQWIAPFTEPRRVVAQDRVTQSRLYRLWNVPRRGERDAVLLSFAAELLAGDKASRLYQRLVTQEGLATSVQADVDANELGSQFGVIVTLKAGVSLSQAEAALDDELAKFMAAPTAAADVQRRKTGYYVARLAGRESIAAKGAELATCQIYEGSPEACEAEWHTVRDATPQDIQSAARRWLTPNHLTVTVEPEAELKTAASSTVDRSKLPAVGEPKGIQLPALQRFTLSNGIEVLLAERHEVPLVNLQMFWPYGTAVQPGAGQFETLMGMLSEGANGLDAEALTAAYSALGANFGADLNADSLGVGLSAPRTKLGEALKLFAANIRKPDFPADALERRVQRKLAGLRANVASPGGILSLNQMRLMYGEHPYGRHNSLPLLEAGSQALTAEALRAMSPTVLRPDGARLIVVGDTDPATLKPLLEAAFGDWAPPAAAAPMRELPAVVVPAGSRVFLFDLPGAEQSLVSAADLSLPVTAPEHEAADLANAVLGGLFTSRLNINLREQKHWTYGAFSGLQESVGPGLFAARASVETPHTAAAMAEMKREIADIAGKRPPTAAELDAARKSLVRALPGQAETAGGVLALYQRLLAFGLPTDRYSGYGDRLAALKPADVTRAAALLARPNALTWFVVGDLAKIEADIRKLKLKLGPVTVLNARGETLR